MDSPTDIELVDLAVAGDAAAFERLVDQNYLLVYKVSYKWCGVKEDAEDIAQEVFVKLARKINTFKQGSSFKTWLYRITINTAKDLYRKNTNRAAMETAFAHEQKLNNPAPGNEVHMDSARLYTVVERLPVKLKEAVILVFAEGLSHKEASEALGCAETTVSWRIFQARKHLKKYLKHEV